MAKEKKIDVKKVAKESLSKEIVNFLVDAGYAVQTDVADYGFSGGTILVTVPDTDIQIKFVTPKAGLTNYEVKVEEVLQLIGESISPKN